ncbi:hypothetical protein BS297_00850 [Rhodococcus erythropolis]|uniref:Uncharacterized protein n=1 Tax=Rhodococcus erythropolis TaxID=1833 RepID=A0A5N5EE60_RHOER|nr:hypothetical protein BS297_00850 [Rhodococcus erythropolis]
MKQAKFKVGQKVRCIIPRDPQESRGGAGWTFGRVFTIARVSSNNWSESDTVYYNDTEGNGVYSEHLELVRSVKTFDNLEVGDIIVDTDGDEAKVLAVLGDVFLKSGWNDFDETASWLTVSEAKSAGWTVKQDTPTEEITELSIAELEKKLDLTAGTLRVKKD